MSRPNQLKHSKQQSSQRKAGDYVEDDFVSTTHAQAGY
jgi:hypothetical protein